MRPGPSNEQMLGAMSVGAQVNVIRAGRVLATDVPVKDVKLEWAADRTVPAQLTYKVPNGWVPKAPLDPMNFYGQRSEVFIIYRIPGVGDVRVALGQYVHTGWKDDGSITAVDLMQVLEDDPMAWPSSPPDGATVRSELQRLAGTIPVVLDAGVADGNVPRTAQWGTSRTEAVLDLAATYDFGVRAGVDGCLHAYPIRDARTVDVLFTHESGALLDSIREPVSARPPNRWVAVGTIDEAKVTVSGTNTRAPFEPDAYGWRTERIEVSSAESKTDVQTALSKAMAEDLVSLKSASIDVVPDGRIEVGDIIGVVAGDGDTYAGRVRSYSLPVSAVGDSMRIDLDILEW